jgi:hypothetical protein
VRRPIGTRAETSHPECGRRLPHLLLVGLTALLAGCGGGGSSSTTVATTTAAVTTTTAGGAFLQSRVRKVTFPQAKRAIDELYETHADVTGFVVRDVAYNATTRDKVLEVCRSGGRETEPASLESVRIAGCAPLIFYYYNYGKQRAVPQAIDVARTLYWYAATSIRGPFPARAKLTALLRSWGLR